MQHSLRSLLMLSLALSICHSIVAMSRAAARVVPALRSAYPTVQRALPYMAVSFVGGMYVGTVMSGGTIIGWRRSLLNKQSSPVDPKNWTK